MNRHPFGHPLQLWGWGELKRVNGWQPLRVWLVDKEAPIAGAQVLFRRIPKIKKTIAYVPRGPIVDPGSASTLLAELIAVARDSGAIFIKIEPAWTEASLPKGWIKDSGILLSDTFVLDLTRSEEELLAAMKQKTRQYVRKGEKEGVVVDVATDQRGVNEFFRLYSESAKRIGFGIHTMSYYQKFFEEFGEASSLYLAEVEGQPVATLWLVNSSHVSFELYGGFSAHSSERANYITKWRAIKDMKTRGVKTYDFNGRFNEGVSRFKEGFGPSQIDFIGSHDFPISDVGHFLWTKGLPLVKSVARIAS